MILHIPLILKIFPANKWKLFIYYVYLLYMYQNIMCIKSIIILEMRMRERERERETNLNKLYNYYCFKYNKKKKQHGMVFYSRIMLLQFYHL
jgi:hypothetical protein